MGKLPLDCGQLWQRQGNCSTGSFMECGVSHSLLQRAVGNMAAVTVVFRVASFAFSVRASLRALKHDQPFRFNERLLAIPSCDLYGIFHKNSSDVA